ncbi:cyclase family protein [Pigmentibacter ruber]|uniref:cyclase family protein n=1 Tax=Pigmentibacter ruber TaxID=2683196 RepID=UPI00131A835C|nr:cyclase family protein [Pigmentibacter ruber]
MNQVNEEKFFFPTLNWKYLSYTWGTSSPVYGNGKKIEIKKERDLCCGDTCNTLLFSASNHVGTHFDFPLHFDKNGKNVLDYEASYFIHVKISIIKMNLDTGHLISISDLKEKEKEIANDTTLLLIDTGSSIYRNQEKYWKNGIGVNTGVADYLREKYPELTTIGLDTISISSFQNREIGRLVHKEFLCSPKPILIIEDLNLNGINNIKPKIIVSLPLRIENADGAPATVIVGY